MLPENKVAIASQQSAAVYLGLVPYFPNEAYPELKDRVSTGKEQNISYQLLRQLMYKMQMDIRRFSTPDWNPLGEIIRPGQKVVIKPNLVRHLHLGGGDYNAVVTHASLVRCVLDYVALALRGEGEITVGDAPVQGADWPKILERTGLREVCEDVSNTWQIPVRLIDFRLWAVELNDNHCVVNSNALKGDPNGYVAVDLGKRSLLAPLGSQADKFRVTNYDCGGMRLHHNETTNEYLIPKTVLDSDVIINLPKLKTHRKVGMTAALKNIVGINGHKDWLPHHRCGSIAEGGDEYREPSFLKKFQTSFEEKLDQELYSNGKFLQRFAIGMADKLSRLMAPDPYLEGSWYGNDTLWRTVLDLNCLLVYANREGEMMETPQRKCLSIVDAIIAGEGEGPMEPEPRPLGLLAGGVNPVAVDAVLATMIGFDYRRIPLIINGFEIKKWPLIGFVPEEIEVCFQDNLWNLLELRVNFDLYCFNPPHGWLGYIELAD